MTKPTPSSTELPAALITLAAAHGIATEFIDWRGRHRAVSAETIRAVLAEFEVAASTDSEADRSAQQITARRATDPVPPCLVTRDSQRVVDVSTGRRCRLTAENGEAFDLVADASGLRLPLELALGYHQLEIQTDQGIATATLILTPDTLHFPAAMGERRLWGVSTQLYSNPSRRSWWIGDTADLATLATWAATKHDAGFVLVNPMHAAEPTPNIESSPYLPVSRRFINPIYLAIDELPEYQLADGALRQELDVRGNDLRLQQATSDTIDRNTIWTAKYAALRLLFRSAWSPERASDFSEFRISHGQSLEDFATWCALARVHGNQWTLWPIELQDPQSVAVADFTHVNADEITFHAWLQFLIDDQLRAVQRSSVEGGMPLGIMHDLAVGVNPTGADTWCLQDVFAAHANVGAPPDAYNQLGQDWGQHPWRPDRLAAVGYAPFRDMVRGILAHAGGVRIDHIIGLFRLWWVPEGRLPTEGTYVTQDHEALIGILALEAERAEAVVVGEDLGTVQPWVREYLAERGILGTSILWFEYDWEAGRPLTPQSWRESSLASVTTHDLPPTSGFLAGAHIDLRDRLGLLTEGPGSEQQKFNAEMESWRTTLVNLDLLEAESHDPEAIINALHSFLGRTPARLILAAVPDLAGDRRIQNQPGTSNEYPNWRVPLTGPDGSALFLEDLLVSSRANQLAALMADQVRHHEVGVVKS
ncbi:MAG: 4-alpha-glucanotransferase [Antricoccus sp.]